MAKVAFDTGSDWHFKLVGLRSLAAIYATLCIAVYISKLAVKAKLGQRRRGFVFANVG